MALKMYPELRQKAISKGWRDPYPLFLMHGAGAAKRGLLFTLTFEQWWELWEPHWPERGRGALEKCMCRKADRGGYEPGNVRIATNKENKHEYSLEYRTRATQRGKRYRSHTGATDIGDATDWTMGRHSFQAYDEPSIWDD
jgi:hypothetical protein